MDKGIVTLSPILHYLKRYRQRIIIKSVYRGNSYVEEFECWGSSLEELNELITKNLEYKKKEI